MPPEKIKLKFKSSIPIRLENALLGFGFTYFMRKYGEFVIYERTLNPNCSADYSDLPDAVIANLNKCVNNISGSFQNPDEHKDLIKARCTNFAHTLEPKKRAWVLDWIKRVVDEDDGQMGDPPWEDPNHIYYGGGFC